MLHFILPFRNKFSLQLKSLFRKVTLHTQVPKTHTSHSDERKSRNLIKYITQEPFHDFTQPSIKHHRRLPSQRNSAFKSQSINSRSRRKQKVNPQLSKTRLATSSSILPGQSERRAAHKVKGDMIVLVKWFAADSSKLFQATDLVLKGAKREAFRSLVLEESVAFQCYHTIWPPILKAAGGSLRLESDCGLSLSRHRPAASHKFGQL